MRSAEKLNWKHDNSANVSYRLSGIKELNIAPLETLLLECLGQAV